MEAMMDRRTVLTLLDITLSNLRSIEFDLKDPELHERGMRKLSGMINNLHETFMNIAN